MAPALYSIPRRIVTRALQPFEEFARAGALGGIVLLACAVVAIAWANSPWSESYFALWHTEFVIGPAGSPMSKSLSHWINDGLMTVFFLLVGLEIKRELLVGELASLRKAALPIAGAIGGMIVPAAIYAALNFGGPGSAGWGIPMATDIAFALGVLTLAGPRVPIGLKVFVTAFAIVDDMGAVLVIALFYTSTIGWLALGIAVAIVVALAALNRLRVNAILPYLVLGVLLWLALLSSGLHATIAGVILALLIPAETPISATEFAERARALVNEFEVTEPEAPHVLTSKGRQQAVHQLDIESRNVQGPLLRLEYALHGAVAFGIMPVFALANAGVRIDSIENPLASSVTLGVAVGLLLGKPIGITLCSWLAVRFLGASLPTGVSLSMIHSVSWIGGIGFTMSLFVAGLAFADPQILDTAKFGIVAGSFIAGFAGFLMLRRNVRTRDPSSPTT